MGHCFWELGQFSSILPKISHQFVIDELTSTENRWGQLSENGGVSRPENGHPGPNSYSALEWEDREFKRYLTGHFGFIAVWAWSFKSDPVQTWNYQAENADLDHYRMEMFSHYQGNGHRYVKALAGLWRRYR